MSNGSDRMNFEEEAAAGGSPSFTPPITPGATNGRQGVVLVNGTTVYGTVTVTKAPLFSAATDTVIFGDFIATSLQNFTAPMRAVVLRLAGTIGSPGAAAAVTVTAPAVTAPMLAGGAIPYVDLSQCRVWSSATKAVTMTGTAGGVLRFGPIAHNALFEQAGPPSAINLLAGAECDFDIRGSHYTQALLGAVGVSNGAIDRDRYDAGSVVSPAVLTISPPFPTGTTLIPYTTPTTAVAVGATATVTNITLLGVGTVRAGVMRSK